LAKQTNPPNNHWYNIDFHIHTPASTDYQQPEIDILEILKRAEEKNLDIMAITDHNTVAGYKKMQEEISQLEALLKLNRILPAEKIRLDENIEDFLRKF
jgi:predicted metal-dependent phosphoesterase TrpH